MAKRRNIRVAVQSSDRFVPGAFEAPSIVQARKSKLEGIAAELQNVLKVGTPIAAGIAERRREKAFLAGTQAALEGREPTAEELKSDAFTMGQQKVRTDSQLVKFNAEVRKMYAKSKNKNDGPALNEEFKGLYKSFWEGLDMESDLDRATARQIMPVVKGIFDEMKATAQKDADIAIRQDMEDDIQITTADEYEATGAVDWEQMNSDLRNAGLAGPRINQIIAATARRLAEENGDVSVIDSLMAIDKWAGGPASAPGNILELQPGLRNSRITAENRKIFNDKKAQADGNKEHEAFENAVDTAVFGMVVGGKAASVPNVLGKAVAEGGYDATEARVWLNFANTYANKSTESDGIVRWDEIAAFEADTANGLNSQEDLTALIASGAAGTGKELADLTVRLTKNMRSARTARRTDPTFTARKDEMNAIYGASDELEKELPQIEQRRTEAMRMWMDLQFGPNPVSADAAMEQVQKALPPKDGNYWENQFRNSVTVSFDTLLTRWRSGVGDEDTILRSLPEGTNILDLLEDHLINSAEYAKLKAAR